MGLGLQNRLSQLVFPKRVVAESSWELLRKGEPQQRCGKGRSGISVKASPTADGRPRARAHGRSLARLSGKDVPRPRGGAWRARRAAPPELVELLPGIGRQ